MSLAYVSTLDRLKESLPGIVTRHDNWPAQGQVFFDLQPIYREPGLLSEIAYQMARPFFGRVDLVLAHDTQGMLIGERVASHLHLPLALAHQGAIPGAVQFVADADGNRFLVPEGAIPPGSRVLLVDDVLATGRTLRLLYSLVSQARARTTGVATILEDSAQGGRHAFPDAYCVMRV
jgi:adenine/guanine phosphoribosyltransferase-like PRPP-binding protein